MSDFFEFLKTSFLHVAPILACGVFAVSIIVERSRALYTSYPLKNPDEFFDKITDFVMLGKLNEAIALCDRYGSKPAAKVAKAALLRAHQPESLIEHGIELAVGDASQMVQKRTTYLATLANVATLLGLFGTIVGLIHSFEAVGHADAQQKAALLAAGISQAMNATMMGLAVAIPCMIAYSFLMNRTNRILSDVDQSAVRSLDLLKQHFYSVEAETFGVEEEEQEQAPAQKAPSNGNGHRAGAKLAQLRRVA